MQAIVPNAALAATGWTNTNGGVSSYQIDALAYDTVNNLLYAGTAGYETLISKPATSLE
jgi:hypothetical protein